MITELQLTARSNIAPFRFVRVDSATENGCVQAGDNTDIIGVGQGGTNKPEVQGLISASYAAEAGQPVRVAGVGSVTMLEVGATVTPGQYLKSDANGRGVPIATTGTVIQNYGAIALQGGTTGSIIRVMVLIGKVRPALT
ncbi:hypothetical protein [Thermogutta sp.]|uniref:hypothetical protein n=1 Tax=Thermogutta sp. TaxID=1962930 RepID=UPI003C7A4CAC